MATRQIAAREKRRITCRIPIAIFERYEGASPEEKRAYNREEINRELKQEAVIVQDLVRRGILHKGNGVEIFGRTCERRLLLPHCEEVRLHSAHVRDNAKRIALKRAQQLMKKRKKNVGALMLGIIKQVIEYTKRIVLKRGQFEKERSEIVSSLTLFVIANAAGYHDIGKTMISQYLLNRENGTVGGQGARRIDFQTELPILRYSHVLAGMSLLELYRPFIEQTIYRLMRLVIGGHHIADNGVGSAMAPSYPEKIGGISVTDVIELGEEGVIKNKLALVQKVIRTADVFSACLENRKYLDESERLIEQVNVEGVTDEDKVLGLLITVAGTDVDPVMVSYLMMCMYDISFEKAYGIVGLFKHEEPKKLGTRGKDLEWARDEVLKRRRFLSLSRRRNKEWGERIDTGEFLSVGETSGAPTEEGIC
jgi:hypothetical protein